MTPEEQAKLQAEEKEKADAEAKAKAEAEASQQNLEIDYEAIAKAETERREAAERLLAEDRYKLSEEKRRQEELGDDEDKPITSKELPAILARERQIAQKESQEGRALDIARANTSSESEAQAAVLFWKNRVIPTGSLEEDMKFAIGGLNSKKIVAKNNELARALRAKDTISNDSTGEHRDGLPNEVPKLPENSPLKGYKYEGGSIYSKVLPSGKTLFRNAKPSPGQPKAWVE